MQLSKNLIDLKRQLENRTYQMNGYYHFVVHEPKRRDIYAASYRDRVVLHCLCDEVLIPILQNRLIYDNAACQKGKGTHFALRRMNLFLQEHYKQYGTEGYILKCDIRKYFASIKHDVLKRQLGNVILDTDIRNMIFHFIDSFSVYNGTGLPLGNQTSQWFGIYHLDCVDRLIKEKLQIKYYIRYMDDLLLLHPSKEYLQKCLVSIKHIIEEELGLELNEKTQIFPLKNGVEFLGWRFYITDTGKIVRKLKAQSKLRYKRRMKKLYKEYSNNNITNNQVSMILASYNGHLKYGHTYNLKQETMKVYKTIMHQ